MEEFGVGLQVFDQEGILFADPVELLLDGLLVVGEFAFVVFVVLWVGG